MTEAKEPSTMFFWERDIEWTFQVRFPCPKAGAVHKSLPRISSAQGGLRIVRAEIALSWGAGHLEFRPGDANSSSARIILRAHYFVASPGKLQAIAFGSANHSSPNSDNSFLAMSAQLLRTVQRFVTHRSSSYE